MYDSSMKSETVPLAMPKDLLREIRRTSKQVGLSMADTMRQSMKLGLHKLIEQLGENRRITNIDPLPDAVLNKIYSRPERDEPGLNRWVRAQATGGRD